MTPDLPTLPVAIYVGAAPQPGDDRPLPEGIWRQCRACDGTGQSVRRWRFRRGWWVATEQALAICPSCSGNGVVRL